MSNFEPATIAGRTVGTAKSVSTTSANYALSGLGVIAKTLRLYNTGASGVFFALGSSAVTATTNDMYLAAGAVALIDIPDVLISSANVSSANIGYITASGASGLSITLGNMRD